MAIDDLATIDASKENWSVVAKVNWTCISDFVFCVGESGRDFRPTSHSFKINFDIQTLVRLVPNNAINLSPYNFVPISDIMFKDLYTSFLIDVIGILTGASAETEFEKDETKQKRITVELDQDGVRVECAFFGKYVAEVVGYSLYC
ncbi:uncharacterized protein LOC130725469 [Lotus japonicus]|uniref:uncharacterized protein LOC130725469 n=1 Tax=Lotus japonicus TaxID=34305 RepID=UPI002585CECF|nr:uncharacterized protein LOC130725469 [Lotus japonicus]